MVYRPKTTNWDLHSTFFLGTNILYELKPRQKLVWEICEMTKKTIKRNWIWIKQKALSHSILRINKPIVLDSIRT